MARKTIGLALSGGGARGFSHVGVLKALSAHGIFPDMIAGTSAGAAVGVFAAAGMSADEIEELSAGITWATAVRPVVSPMGIFSNRPLGSFIKKHLQTNHIRDLKLPFSAIAYDVVKGEEAVITEGDISEAVRASCAVPGIFTPVRTKDGRMLVDGAVTSGLPVDQVRAMGADIVIAVDLISCGVSFRTEPRTALGVMIRSALTLIRTSVHEQRQRADIVIDPQIAHIRPDQMNRKSELLELGEAAAVEKIAEIKTMADEDV
jgi:NTE family protein